MSSITDKGRLKQKRGIIDNRHPENYKAWLHTRDCTRGDGTRHIVCDIYNPRKQVYLMSDLELNAYYILRTRSDVIELCEQYPLDIEVTKDICKSYGIKHPRIPGTKTDITMTTDFLLVKKQKMET